MQNYERLKEQRKLNKYSQTEIAAYLETKQTVYARYERNVNIIPTKHIIKLCKLYNISADYLLCLIDEKRPLY